MQFWDTWCGSKAQERNMYRSWEALVAALPTAGRYPNYWILGETYVEWAI